MLWLNLRATSDSGFCQLRGAEMLNIRINLTIDLKKVGAILAAIVIAASQLVGTPANALPAQPSVGHEKVVTVSLAYLTVRTTKSDAEKALASEYVKYFDAQTIAFLTEYANGESMAEWKCLDKLWTHESHFNPKALNKHSEAYGIAQFLPSTWGNYKVTKTASASLQIKYGLHYIDKRYGSACNAWSFWKNHNWY
jgi:hypothetical protein